MRSRRKGPVLPVAYRPRRLQQWWLDRSVRVKGLIVVAIPLIALIATTSASLALQVSERHQRSNGTAASGLINAANQLLSDALNAETGVRGYAATRDPLVLAPYNATLAQISADRRTLRHTAMVNGDSSQQRAVDATMGTVLAELAALRSAISSGMSMRALRPALENGSATMDVLRGQISALVRPSAVSLVTHRTAITRLENAIDILNIVGLTLGLLAGLAGIALFTSGISSRLSLSEANARRLGEGRPLEPAVRARDELGRVAASHIQAAKLLASRATDLTTARDQALKATQAKNAFLSSTSHELRTPLNAILGFTQLLEMSDLCEEDQDSVRRILGAGRHLLALINELIDIARIESGDLSLSVEPIPIFPLVEEASQLMAPLAAERSIRIIQQCALPTLAAQADRQRLSQVLMNLVSNAVKYNQRGGTITISCQEEATGHVSIAVSDTGPGLTAENLERIFVPFERLGADQTNVEGTGIGLPLARALAEAMRGRLTASSVPGQGSVFTITLLRAPDVVHVPPERTAPSPPAVWHAPAGSAMGILYIEDNPANVEVVSRFLRGRPNVRLQSVTSGQVGLEYAARDIPDLILLDLHLQDTNGEQVLNELKADPATAAIPVVVLSAEASPNVIRRLLANGAVAYLTKPLNLTELGGLLDSFAAPGQSVPAPGRNTPA